MKIIFCDFDGVINSRQFFYKQKSSGILLIQHESEMFDLAALERLNKILVETGARIVVSSTWRSKGVEKLKDLFVFCGFPLISERIVDVTEISSKSRGQQIQNWLKNKEINSYCILEDDPDSDMLEENLVQTKYETGLLDDHVARAIKILK